MEQKPKFSVGQEVVHRNGGHYRIEVLPDHRRLEYCNEPFYEYRALSDDTVWLRCQSEMEDGRFTLAHPYYTPPQE